MNKQIKEPTPESLVASINKSFGRDVVKVKDGQIVTMGSHEFQEVSARKGENTPYAATLIILPIEDDEGVQWRGYVKFDNESFNWKNELYDYYGAPYPQWDDWVYPNEKTVGAYLMGLLVNWHRQIVELFERVRSYDNER